MKKKFAYLFTIGGKIVWSGEDASHLPNRAANDIDRNEIEEFILSASVGSHIELSTGEFIFRTA